MIVHVGKHTYQMPDFIHDFGNEFHHNCPRINPHTQPSVRNWIEAELHEIIEAWLLYPLSKFLIDNDGRSIGLLRSPLSFLWGIVCGFPLRDVILYTIWEIQGCKPIRVWDEKRKIIYG